MFVLVFCFSIFLGELKAIAFKNAVERGDILLRNMHPRCVRGPPVIVRGAIAWVARGWSMLGRGVMSDPASRLKL